MSSPVTPLGAHKGGGNEGCNHVLVFQSLEVHIPNSLVGNYGKILHEALRY